MAMLAALIHWRIKPEMVDEFMDHWKTQNRVPDRSGLVAEFLSDPLEMETAPYITWHLDGESLGDFRSFVTVGIWSDGKQFEDQITGYFNDKEPMKDFEKYRRRRVVFEPVAWRIGQGQLPNSDSPGVL